jgi:ornithine cyclodeaminase/alanine dehydrogenase-like protein (mu-crystallin family)
MVLLLDEDQIAKVLRYETVIRAMEKALAHFSTGRVIQPVRNMIVIEEGKRHLGIMPVVAEDAVGG